MRSFCLGMRPGGAVGIAAAVLQMSLGCRGLLVLRRRDIGPVALGLVSSQLRTFSMTKEPELEANPFYRKYRDKIQQLRRSDPAAFVACMEKRKEQQGQVVSLSAQSESLLPMEGKVKSGSDKEAILKNKTMNSLLNVELVTDKSGEDIAQIWTEFFATRDTVYAVIPGEAFDLVWRRSGSCPSFLYALPREDGYEFFVGQWSGAELHFTALINIQTVGDSAQSQLILHHYRELQECKGIVLMMGECDSTFLNVQDARCLANQVQLFYASDEFQLVQTFNHNPSDFKYMAVVAALERS